MGWCCNRFVNFHQNRYFWIWSLSLPDIKRTFIMLKTEKAFKYFTLANSEQCQRPPLQKSQLPSIVQRLRRWNPPPCVWPGRCPASGPTSPRRPPMPSRPWSPAHGRGAPWYPTCSLPATGCPRCPPLRITYSGCGQRLTRCWVSPRSPSPSPGQEVRERVAQVCLQASGSFDESSRFEGYM